MGLVFVFVKLVVKRIAKRLAFQQFDGREAVAFFGVDLSVLTLSVWIALGVPKRMNLSEKQTVIAYTVLIILIFCTACIYKRYLRLAATEQSGVWHKLHLWSNVFVGLCLGFWALLFGMKAI
jgi:hypothetical protein